MIINKKLYKTIYTVYNAEELKDEECEDFLMCGTPNWNQYFLDNKHFDPKVIDFDKNENVECIEFDNKEEMSDFWDSLDNMKKIDWSFEADYFLLLKYA